MFRVMDYGLGSEIHNRGFIGESMGDYIGGFKQDAKSLDYSSNVLDIACCVLPQHVISARQKHMLQSNDITLAIVSPKPYTPLQNQGKGSSQNAEILTTSSNPRVFEIVIEGLRLKFCSGVAFQVSSFRIWGLGLRGLGLRE